MKNTFFLVVVGFAVGVGVLLLVLQNPLQWEWMHRVGHALVGGPEVSPAEAEAQLWTCGMHPQVIQDEPGYCPICGMKLVPVKGTQDGAAADAKPVRDCSAGCCAARAADDEAC